MKGLFISFFFFIISTLLIQSCVKYRYVYFEKKPFQEIKNIYLLSVKIDNQSDSVDNDVVYYSSSFINQEFIKGFLDTINNNSNDLSVKMISPEKQISLYEDSGEQLIAFKDQALAESLKSLWIKKNHSMLSGDAYATIEVKTSVWKQDAVGFFRVYSPQGHVIWREEINHFSSYIEFDKKSPYLIKNRELLLQPLDNSHYQEIQKTFHLLGEKVAESLKISLDKMRL